MLPRDPMILLSLVNTKLRDEYATLSELCEVLDEDQLELTSRLEAIGFHYDPAQNQFR